VSKKRTLLWNGDAGVSTGFANVTHQVLAGLQGRWNTPVLGINYGGDPHPYPYKMFPCLPGGDSWGLGRLQNLIHTQRPDVVVLQNDPWNIAEYIHEFAHQVPLVAYMPVDGLNVQGSLLNGLALAIFYTEFGRREAIAGGYTGPSAVVPLGIDLDTWSRGDRDTSRHETRLSAHIPEGSFLVGNVNRNQPRKRIDLTIQYFAKWIATRDVDDAYLVLHMAPTGDQGWDIEQLMTFWLKHYGVRGRRLIVTSRNLIVGVGLPTTLMRSIYRGLDVQLSTTQGEGWGLTTMEGMACGTPQVVPDWSALGEWATAAERIRCSGTSATVRDVNIIGGVPDEAETIDALDRLYADPQRRAEMRDAGVALVQQPQYRPAAISDAFDRLLTDVVTGRFRETPVAAAPVLVEA
jgi:glycosyltransferase involved in cell wall biosynthesis